jgi:hypothetical protein
MDARRKSTNNTRGRITGGGFPSMEDVVRLEAKATYSKDEFIAAIAAAGKPAVYVFAPTAAAAFSRKIVVYTLFKKRTFLDSQGATSSCALLVATPVTRSYFHDSLANPSPLPFPPLPHRYHHTFPLSPSLILLHHHHLPRGNTTRNTTHMASWCGMAGLGE